MKEKGGKRYRKESEKWRNCKREEEEEQKELGKKKRRRRS